MNHLSPNIYSNPYMYTQIMSKKEYQETLNATNGEINACGYVWTVVGKQVGAGMYRVSAKKKIY